MVVRLLILDEAYVLSTAQDGRPIELARLPGGAEAMGPLHSPVDESQFESAMQVAQNWLSPHAAALRGQVLEVADETGRLEYGLREVLGVNERVWHIQDLEMRFQSVEGLSLGILAPQALPMHPHFVLDLLLLRETAQHGQVLKVRLN
jgi:hypothetical protein